MDITYDNPSQVPHSIAVATANGNVLGQVQPFSGGKQTVDLTNLAPGKYVFYCTVPGHREAGMQGDLTVLPSNTNAGPNGQQPLARSPYSQLALVLYRPMIAEMEARRLSKAHADFERARGRVWVERVRVGLEYRRAMRGIDEEIARIRLVRDRLIRQSVAAGASYREVARTLGLSHSRIQQIVNSSSK